MRDSTPAHAPRRPAVHLARQMFRGHRPALAILLVLAVTQTATAQAGPWLVGVAIDQGISDAVEGRYRILIGVGVALATSAVVSAVLNRFWLTKASRVGQTMLVELRSRLFDRVQRHAVSFHERVSSGQVISRLTADVDAVNNLLSTALTGLLPAVLSVAVISVVMVILDPLLAAVALLTLLPLAALTGWFSVRAARAYRQQQSALGDLTVQLVETLNGIRAVQAFRREAVNDAIFGELSSRHRAAGLKANRLGIVFFPGMELLFGLATAVVMVVGGIRVSQGTLEIGVLAAFVLYVTQLFGPILNLTAFFDSLQSAFAGLERIAVVLSERLAVPEPERPARLEHPVRGQVALTDVSFTYPQTTSGANPALRQVDLSLEAGQTVAMLGATGAGKSTVAKLIARFHDPDDGVVRVDGVDLRDVSDDDLRAAIGLVTQDGFLFSGSIADNILLGRPDASPDEMIAAARTLGADAFISALPEAYDTEVGPRGNRLSAGQRQLVAFTRALLADPAVLILDEATSALDIPTERTMQHGLRKLLKGRTALIIAHRLSTVEFADRVVVVSDGRIVEDGIPRELLRAGSPEFSALYRDGVGHVGVEARRPSD